MQHLTGGGLMPYLPLAPVSEALYGVFQDATLLALAAGGVHTDVPEDPTYPFLWFEVIENLQLGGFGTKPGLGALPEVGVRLHAFTLNSSLQGWADCQVLLSRAIALIADAPTVTGYDSCAIFHDSTVPVDDGELNGVKVKELVSIHRLYLEEQ